MNPGESMGLTSMRLTVGFGLNPKDQTKKFAAHQVNFIPFLHRGDMLACALIWSKASGAD